MTDRITSWGCDVPISMPEPVDPADVVVDMGSHVFTPQGLKINVTSSVLAEIFAPTYAPPEQG